MIKILIGGSPCTFWSIAQKNHRETEAEGLGWELFKNYLVAKEKFNPDIFLYENNVSAAKAIKEQIKEELKVNNNDSDARYIEINSALVSAQNRKRFYVHNCGDVGQPEDRGILLKDVLETQAVEAVQVGYRNRREADGKLYRRFETSGLEKSNALTTVQTDSMVASPVRIGTMPQNNGKVKDNQATRIYDINGKHTAVTTSFLPKIAEPVTGLICHNIPQEVRVRKYTCDIEELKELLRSHKNITNKEIADKLGKPVTMVEHWFRKDNCFSVPDPDIWEDLKKLLNIETNKFDDYVTVFETKEGAFEKSQRCYDVNGKMSTLMTGSNDNIIEPITVNRDQPIYEVKDGKINIKGREYPIKLNDGYYIIRKLMPIECERLQTLPDNYTAVVSNAQRYKGLGNGWTAEVIIHILNGALKDVPKDEEIVVLSMYDGIATGRYCLDKMGFTNVTYFAYEIDKFAKQVAMSNYPDIIQMGDAFQVREPDWTIGY